MGLPANDGHMVQQPYGDNFHEPNQCTGPLGAMMQSSCCQQRPGTSAGSTMQHHQSFGMVPDPPSLTPPFNGCSNNNHFKFVHMENRVAIRKSTTAPSRRWPSPPSVPAAPTTSTGTSFGRLLASAMPERYPPEDGGGTGIVGVADETPIDATPRRRARRGIGRAAPAVRSRAAHEGAAREEAAERRVLLNFPRRRL